MEGKERAAAGVDEVAEVATLILICPLNEFGEECVHDSND